MLGTIIESCGDTLDESHMPLGWPMSIDGAVRQFCMHKRDTIQELNNMLAEFNLQRSSIEINRSTTLWSHNSVWNKKYMDPNPGHTLQQLWDDAEHYISQKVTRSREVTEEAMLQAVRELQNLPQASPPSNLFVQTLGRPNREHVPPQNCENFRHQWDESIGLLCIGRSEFVFHLDGEIIRDGWQRVCTFHVLHVLLEMTKPNNDILFVFFEYFDCTENIVRIWICIVTWKIKPFSICFALFLSTERSQNCTKESWEDRRIHFDFGRRNFVWHWSEKFRLFCLSMMIARATFWRSFRTWSCW